MSWYEFDRHQLLGGLGDVSISSEENFQSRLISRNIASGLVDTLYTIPSESNWRTWPYISYSPLLLLVSQFSDSIRASTRYCWSMKQLIFCCQLLLQLWALACHPTNSTRKSSLRADLCRLLSETMKTSGPAIMAEESCIPSSTFIWYFLITRTHSEINFSLNSTTP
jgi:hypothetical protein